MALDMLLGLLFMVLLSCGGWIVWGIAQSRQRAHALALAREREETERLRLRLQAQDRVQERADRIYLDAVREHTDPAGPAPHADGGPERS